MLCLSLLKRPTRVLCRRALGRLRSYQFLPCETGAAVVAVAFETAEAFMHARRRAIVARAQVVLRIGAVALVADTIAWIA